LVVKCGVCLQGDDLSSKWDCVTFARTHSFKDNNQPKVFEWDVFVSPGESRSQFGIKIVCKEIHVVEKSRIISPIYKLPDRKIAEMDRKLFWAIGLPK